MNDQPTSNPYVFWDVQYEQHIASADLYTKKQQLLLYVDYLTDKPV